MKTQFVPLASAIAAFGLALTASSTPVVAQSMSIGVQYSDLDLTSPQGQATLDKRIAGAARKICGHDEQRSGTRIAMNPKMRACVAEVKAKTAKQVAAATQERQLGG